MIKNRFGRIEDKFFRLIPKALAFRPIDDIKDFVYSYVLDEKEVNIDDITLKMSGLIKNLQAYTGKRKNSYREVGKNQFLTCPGSGWITEG